MSYYGLQSVAWLLGFACVFLAGWTSHQREQLRYYRLVAELGRRAMAGDDIEAVRYAMVFIQSPEARDGGRMLPSEREAQREAERDAAALIARGLVLRDDVKAQGERQLRGG